MQAATKALRAITFVTFRRIFLPIIWISVAILLVLWLIVFLLSFSLDLAWLWLLIVVIPVTIIAVAVLALLWFVSSRLTPRSLSKHERSLVTQFTDKIIRLAETRATPWPVMAALIAKDVVRGRRSSYINNLIADSSSLKRDFTDIKALFE